MFRAKFICAVAVLALAACGSDQDTAPTPPAKNATKAAMEHDPEAYKKSMKAAMAEVPKQLRPEFQRLFVCEVVKNSRTATPRAVTADFVREVIEKIKRNSNAGYECLQEIQATEQGK